MTDFKKIESLFAKLLTATTSVLSESEVAEIQRFIDVGEYGLALETAIHIFVEERKLPSADVVELFKSLAIAMQVDPEPLLKKLVPGTTDRMGNLGHD